MDTFTTGTGDGHLHNRKEMDTFITGRRWTPSQQGQGLVFTISSPNSNSHARQLRRSYQSKTQFMSHKNLKLLAFLKSIKINTQKVKKNAYFNGTSCENKRSFNLFASSRESHVQYVFTVSSSRHLNMLETHSNQSCMNQEDEFLAGVSEVSYILTDKQYSDALGA